MRLFARAFRLGFGQSTLGLVFFASAVIGVASGYAGGHLSDHIGRRPLILVGWACQAGILLVAAATGAAAAGIAVGRRRAAAATSYQGRLGH